LQQIYPVLSARETNQKEAKRKEPGILQEKTKGKLKNFGEIKA
jgi:hypothetical protein